MIIECCRPGNGRSWPTFTELADRVADADVDINDRDLDVIVGKLIDCGQLIRFTKGMGRPVTIAINRHREVHQVDRLDLLEASICQVMRAHDAETMTSLDQLETWLTEAGIEHTSRDVQAAVGHLFDIGRITQPRVDHWESDDPRPYLFQEPRVIDESATSWY